MWQVDLMVGAQCFLSLAPPAAGVKNISNQLTIGQEISTEHPELRSLARAEGWWSGEGGFSFSEVYAPVNPPARMEAAKLRYCGGKELLSKHDGEESKRPAGHCPASERAFKSVSLPYWFNLTNLPSESVVQKIPFFF